MPSYLITGVSKGLGVSCPLPFTLSSPSMLTTLLLLQYEFLRQHSSNPANVVIGLVRDKAGTEQKIAQDPELKDRTNIHILEADQTNYDALKVSN